MRLTALNLWHGGGKRVEALGDYLLRTESDILVCPEHRASTPSKALSLRLGQAGYRAYSSPTSAVLPNGVTIFARPSAEAAATGFPDNDPSRVSAIRIGSLCIVGVYFGQGQQKKRLFDYLLSKPAMIGPETLIAGDFNTGRHNFDEGGATFDCAEEFEQLLGIGYVDLWRRQHGTEAREWSWLSNRGNGFRLDHAFATGELAARARDCRYDHSTRGTLSDHSAMIVDFDNA